MKIRKIKKRDGRITDFDQSKITNAIYKATEAIGKPDFELAKKLSDKTTQLLQNKELPTVEEIQDTVEQVLMAEGEARIAKAYILYRQKRAEIRKEKQKILNKTQIDEVDKAFDINALKVLSSRYLKKDNEGKVSETPKQLFERVAIHTAIASILFDKKVFDKKGSCPQHPQEEFDEKKWVGKLKIGDYSLNQFHLEALKRLYDRFNKKRQMKVSWRKFLELLRQGEFFSYQEEIRDYYNIMVEKKFMPNTPALANFGNYLGMGSACFHPEQLISTLDGPKKISEIKIGDEVLTHRGRFRRVKEIFIREVNSLLSIDCRKLPKPTLLVTDEHPILVYKNGKIDWQPAFTIKEGDWVALSYPVETKDIKEIKVSDIVKEVNVKNDKCYYEYKGGRFNAFCHTTKPVRDSIEVDYDLMKLFGFYLAEGTVSNSNCVRFTFSIDELEYCNEIISVMEKKFGITTKVEINSDVGCKWLSLRFHSVILAKFFEKIFGTGYSNKKIPYWIMLLPSHKQKGLMSGMIRGDGTIFRNWNKINARLVMSNTNLVYGFWQMCMRCGVFPALGKESMPKMGKLQPLRCTLGDARGQLLMNELFNRSIDDTIGKDRTFVKDGIVFTEVENIQRIDYKGIVYNLEVEEDNSYVANMVSVHNCFVLGIEDSIESIMETLKQASVIFKAGGGAGYNFSRLRAEGDFVKTTGGVASGPISFMTLFDRMTEVIKQGGIRRGANIGILNSNHPDIEKFVVAKKENKALNNFNISVFILSDFWDYYKENKPYPLINPRTKEIIKYLDPKNFLDLVSYQIWESAEPGVIFDDTVNKYNPFLDTLGKIEATNPCGEVLLYPYESCNLGSINLWAFVKESPTNEGKRKVSFDWEEFSKTIHIATKFLDNVVEVNKYPLPQIEEMTLNTRKIGLGVMGLGNLLFDLEIPYNSSEGLKLMERIMEFLNFHSKLASIKLAKERGKFPYYQKSFYPKGRLPFSGSEDKDSWNLDWDDLKQKIKRFGLRNAFTTVIAPTGSISMIAGCSSGIEPVFSLVYEKRVSVGSFYYIDPVFEKIMLREGLFDEDLIRETAERSGSIQDLPYIPNRLKKVFLVALDMKASDHIKALASFQKWTDSSISKTINLAFNSTIEEVKEAILLAHQLGCKDLTLYRDKSIRGVLIAGERKKKEKKETKLTSLEDTKAKGLAIYHDEGVILESDLNKINEFCPVCEGVLVKEESCKKCLNCGWSVCSL